METLKLIQAFLSITFVYGVVRLITFTKIFNSQLVGIIESVFTKPNTEKPFGMFLIILDYIFFYFSLCFQSWFWLFKLV